MKSCKQYLSFLLAVALMSMSLNNAGAAIVTNDIVVSQLQQNSAKTELLQTISRSDVKEQLLALGVNPADVESRINLMTHEEIAQLNQKIDELPAGGDVLGILLVIFIVFVITDVIGATDIFPFIHPVN
ncbi:MAG: PA2779 family protein [Gammaproteobacteria bacterium]